MAESTEEKTQGRKLPRILNVRKMGVLCLSETAVIVLLCLGYVHPAAGIPLLIVYFIGITATVARLRTKSRWFATFLLCLLLGGVTAISFTVQADGYRAAALPEDGVVSVTGTVESTVSDGAAVRSVVLSDLRIDGAAADGNARVYLEEEILSAYVPLGWQLRVTGKTIPASLFRGTFPDGAVYRKNLRYYVYASAENMTVRQAKPPFFVRVRGAIYDRLRAACGAEYGAVAYCMLTGDKGELGDATVRTFGLAGIGHVLAVSGLHVGLIAGMLLWLLRRLHVRKLTATIEVTAALWLYACFVGLSASVVRACLMTTAGLWSAVSGQRKDILSSLSLAACAILAAQPLSLFEAGFLLSFSAVFGLALFARSFERGLRKIKLPHCIASPLAAAAAVHIGIFPVTAYCFGAVQTYSAVCNLLLLPLLGLLFTGFVLFSPVCVAFGISFPLRMLGVGLAFTDTAVSFSARLPFATLPVAQSAALFLLYPAYFAASRYVMLPRYKRTVTAIVTAMIALSAAAPVGAAQIPPKTDGILLSVGGGAVNAVLLDDGKVTAITDGNGTSALKTALKQYNVHRLDVLLLHGLNETNGRAISDFLYEIPADRVVCPLSVTESAGLAKIGAFGNFYTWEESDLPRWENVESKERHGGYLYTAACGTGVLFVSYRAHYADFSAEIVNRAPVIRSFLYTGAYADRVYLTDTPAGYLGELPTYQYSVAALGTFAFDLRTGEITVK